MSESMSGYEIVFDHKIDGAPNTWYRSLDGKMTVEISVTTHDKTYDHDLMRLWIKHGYMSEWLDATLTVRVFFDDGKDCHGWYNPCERLDESGTRMVIDFDWILEATQKNVERIMRECERMRREEIRIKPARR